ncbi:hypothetical protein JTB14_007835 [Gonioctena quinquepunctata]|nr:hypothetical protein JTB14_007835 [Gonioctena quinquepunctata]
MRTFFGPPPSHPRRRTSRRVLQYRGKNRRGKGPSTSPWMNIIAANVLSNSSVHHDDFDLSDVTIGDDEDDFMMDMSHPKKFWRQRPRLRIQP